MNPEMLNPDERVVFSILKLSRAMRRCPPPRGELPFPPAVGRLLECVAAAPGVSSRELCEALDLRPSSLSEILARAEGEGLLTRAVDEEDRRVLHISLTEKGRSVVREMETAREEDAKKKASCLTEEEKLTLATVNALFGGMLLCSDDMGKYNDKALELYRRTLETRGAENIRDLIADLEQAFAQI